MYRALVVSLLVLAACPNQTPEGQTEEGVPQQQTYSARGLYTFPNNLSEVPDGAFSRADDAVIRREGIIETRRGFAPLTGSFGSSGDRLNVLSDYIGTLVGHTTASKVVRYLGGSWAEYAGTYAPPAGHRMRFLQSAKSLYFTTSTGVKRVDEVTGAVYDAGVPQATGGAVALSSNGAHATGTVTLGGGAGNVTITVGGTAVVTNFITSDTATAAAAVVNLNANATVAALVTASSVGTVITLTAVNGGSAGNAITLTTSRTAGTSVASGATLTGGVTGAGWLPAGAQVAYRFVWGFRNANDRVILGAPSGRLSLTNPATETTDTVQVTVQVPEWVTTEYFLQVYRADYSASATIPAGDDMALAYETYPSAAQIAQGTLAFTDVTPDELKGAPLYSSPNAGIPGSEKFQPPVCLDLAEYKERVWCLATIQRQRLLLTLLSVDSTSGGLADGNALRFVAASSTIEVYTAGAVESGSTFKRFTDGTASQNVENTTRSLIHVINAESAEFAAFYVSGEFDSPGQLVVEAKGLGVGQFAVTAIGTAAPWIPAMPAFVHASLVSRTGSTVTVTIPSTAGLRVGDPLLLSEDFSYSNGTDTANFPPGSYVIATIPNGTQFTYTSAGPATTSLDTISYLVDTPALLSDPTDAPNGLAYAEYGEGADAVPLGNYLAVGAANYYGRRIIPLGDTLFIFKDEGVYILTGDSPETFSTRAYPTPAKIVAASTAVVLGNAIYVLTDQGVMAFSESGAQLISRPIEGTLAAFYAGEAALRATTASIAFAVGYETEREYHLFLPTDASSTYATQEYVYNYVTRAWTRWTVPATAGHVLPSDGLEYLGNPTANAARVERKTRTGADYQDATGVAITAYVDWQVRTGDDPGGYKHWQKVTAMIEQPSPTTVTLSLGTELSATRASGPFTLNGLPYVSTYVPVNQSRSQTLTVGVSGGQVGVPLALKGLAVDLVVPSTKLR